MGHDHSLSCCVEFVFILMAYVDIVEFLSDKVWCTNVNPRMFFSLSYYITPFVQKVRSLNRALNGGCYILLLVSLTRLYESNPRTGILILSIEGWMKIMIKQ